MHFSPYVRAARRPAWIEEPTSPDDILGTAAIRRAVAPVRVASGEHVANRVLFKQLLQAQAIDVMQIDACRVAGVNENIANLLLAAKFGVPVYPHAGGVGLCEIVQRLSMFDYVAVSGTPRMIAWIDHLHEHFEAPAVVSGGYYVAPEAPGASTRMRPESVAEYTYPGGAAWQELAKGGHPRLADHPGLACRWSSAARRSAGCTSRSATPMRPPRWRPRGTRGSARSTPRRTTGWACRSGASAISWRAARDRSSRSARRSAGGWCPRQAR